MSLLPATRARALPAIFVASFFPLCALFALAPLALPGCMMGGQNAASKLATAPTYDPPNQAKCGVKKSSDHPLIVEWPSADRATLEAKAQSGLVAVRYVGCEMEVLHRCRLPGKYAYTSITPKHDAVTIRNADDLFANMPVGAGKLEGKLEQSGQLNVSMTIVGRYEADHTSFSPSELADDDCERATHVVSGMTTGAFELSAGAAATVGGEASAFGMGAGGKSTSAHETLERDGHEDKCEAAGGRSGQPPDGCGAVLRLEVVPIEPPKRARAAAATAGPEEDPDTIAPNLYPEGNLRVAVHCAEREWIQTPETGLEVLVDGKAAGEKALKTNIVSTMGVQTVNNTQVPVVLQNATDVGYLVHPGDHHLSIRVPDCAPIEADVKVSGTHAVNVEGDMEVSRDMLKGPVGAPWGGAWLLGAYYSGVPNTVFTKTGETVTVNGSPAAIGGTLGFTYEHRYFTMGVLYDVGSASYSGHVHNDKPTSGTGSPDADFTGSQFQMLVELRAGARLPLRYVALMGGSGIGGAMWIASATVANSGANVTPPNSLSGTWHLPLWAAVDLKPFCDWGLQVGGAYNFDPTDSAGSYAMLNAGLIWQPNPSCSRTAAVQVSP
ncbi:MAG TPA: hypothetical protein VIF15_12900 [Polyangiaceae bacterium]